MTQASKVRFDVVTVTLNPAIDRTLTIPNFAAGSVHRVQDSVSQPGGKGVNVAAALAEYGLRVAATGLLGCENAGLFEQLFQEKRIADKFVRIAGKTRVCIKIADPALGQTTDLNFPGLAPLAHDLDALWGALARLDARCFVVSGSLPEGVPPSLYSALIEQLRGSGRRVFVDTSGDALRAALAARPHVVKPNIHELSALLGVSFASDAEILAAARELVGSGIERVVVSMGALGACFVDAQQAWIVRPPALHVERSVGAGDAMVAGLVASELAGGSFEDCARLATAFSIAALTRSAPRESSRSAVHGALRDIERARAVGPAAH